MKSHPSIRDSSTSYEIYPIE
jgi:hypothetical protein